MIGKNDPFDCIHITVYLTTAYRKINGAADGFPGWTIDRYGKWLLVQHDEMCYKGPLPSIHDHDGNTYGVYYLPANLNRSAMGSRNDIHPKLLEGQHALDVLPVLKNGVTYHVSLDKDLSTGSFLAQRLQRAWLTQNCDESTRVLNCFAHCIALASILTNLLACTRRDWKMQVSSWPRSNAFCPCQSISLPSMHSLSRTLCVRRIQILSLSS